MTLRDHPVVSSPKRKRERTLDTPIFVEGVGWRSPLKQPCMFCGAAPGEECHTLPPKPDPCKPHAIRVRLAGYKPVA
jgi:hypothetical protein